MQGQNEGTWKGQGQTCIKAVMEDLTKGLSSPGFVHQWAEQGHYRRSRCCRKTENCKRGNSCKMSTRCPEVVARGLSASACSNSRDRGCHVVGGPEWGGPQNGSAWARRESCCGRKEVNWKYSSGEKQMRGSQTMGWTWGSIRCWTCPRPT